ncbi:MAG: flagellar basal body rod protein FlgC [Pyrinomonadaceae bacterium]
MSLYNIFKISSQGMTAQRERLEAASANLANANSTRSTDGKVYKRRDVVFTAIDINDRWGEVSAENGLGGSRIKPQGVNSEVVIADENQQPNRQHQPWNPDADADGYVNMPDVDPLEETVNMMSAARAFEANATVFGTAKEMARVSLNLGDV